MYRSTVDTAPQELTFAFDPLRPLHAHDASTLAWREFPYKQVVIDKLCTKFSKPKLSEEAAAGALLIGRGDFNRAVFEVNQHLDHDDGAANATHCINTGWQALEERFRTERIAFTKAKQEYLKNEKLRVAAKVQSIAQKDNDEQARIAHETWKRRQIIKWYDNGSKYDGEGINQHGVLIPHGHGTLWVPSQKSSIIANASGDMKRIPRYTGEWMDGFMHGKGTYYWHNGDSWEGVLCRDELQGKGVFNEGYSDDMEDSADATAISHRVASPKEQRVRYYDASQHVCWGDELVRGCRLRVFENRLYGDPLVSVVRRHNVDLEEETECVIVNHDANRDQYQVRKTETEQTKWISLSNTNFRIVSSRPVARYEPGE